MKRALVLALASLAAGCEPDPLPPEGQVRLFVDTDALLPLALGQVDDDQMALFDRLRIEVFPPGATEPCSGCTREFGIDHETVFEARASVGIATPPGKSGYRARIRLYRSGGADVAAARPTSTLEAVVSLPEVGAEGIADVHVVLRTDELGTPQGTLEAPASAQAGPANGKLARTWASNLRRGCAGAAQPGEVCVPGAAYWMGDPTFDVPSEHLVVVGPFYLSATEVTVASFRDSGFAMATTVVPHTSAEACTYTETPDVFDGHPVTCVVRAAALSYCEALGGTLPSEAQWELAAGARRSAHHVWGSDSPECEYAVYARSGDPTKPPELSECDALGVGVQPVGSGSIDRLDLEGGTILDLMGNVSEWVSDEWAKEGEPCWSANLLVDPVCATKSTIDPPSIALRGANWSDPGIVLRAAIREKIVTDKADQVSSRVGFRCARRAL